MNGMDHRDSQGTGSALLLALLFLLCYLAPLGLRPLAVPDEMRYAEISREMVVSGDWVVPRLLGLRYFEKPVGGYWLNNLSQVAFGENAFAVRLPTALATGVTALLLLLLARSGTGDARKGRVAALLYLSSIPIFGMGTFAVLDSMFTMWLTAEFFAFWHAFRADSGRSRAAWWAVFGAACGMAFLTKGFIALAVPVVALVPLMLWQRRWRELLLYGSLSVVTAGIVALPWAIAIHLREGDFWNFFFVHEHLDRFAGDDVQHDKPFWYYLPIMIALTVPWTAVAPGALRAGWLRGVRRAEPFQRFLLLAFLMPLALFSIAEGKLPTYVLPCYGPLAILMASAIVDQLDRGRTTALRAATWVNLALGILVLVGVGVGLIFAGESELLVTRPRAPWVLVSVFVPWVVLGIAMVKRWIEPVTGLVSLSFCLLPGVLQVRELGLTRWQELLAQVAEEAAPGTRLACASVRLIPAVAWEFQSTDVQLVENESELEYGLSYADAAGRHIDDEEFQDWLASARADRPVILFVLQRRHTVLETYLPADRILSAGKLTIFFYDPAS